MSLDPDIVRQDNIEDGILLKHERAIFDTMSLHRYQKDRARRGVPPLTFWQAEQLRGERIWHAIFFKRKPRQHYNRLPEVKA